MTPRNFGDGGVVDTRRMFHAAWAASQRPGARPTRGSGLGAVADTIGVTGGGMTAGGGVGGGGGLPRPRPPLPSGAVGVSVDGGAAAGGGASVVGAVVATAGGDGGVLEGVGAAVLGGLDAAGDDGGVDFDAHATARMPAAIDARTKRLIV